MKKPFLLLLLLISATPLFAQPAETGSSVWLDPGILITIALILIPLLIVVYLVAVKVNNLAVRIKGSKTRRDARQLAQSIRELDLNAMGDELSKRKQAIEFELSNTELAGEILPEDKKGLLHNIAEVDSPG